MSEIKRYDTSENFVHEFDGMKTSEYGEWVKHSDHEAETSQLKAKIAKLEAKVGPLEELRKIMSCRFREISRNWGDQKKESHVYRNLSECLQTWAKATAKAKRDSQ